MKMTKIALALGAVAVLGGCAASYSSAELDKMANDMINQSFKAKGIAGIDRLKQDEINLACSAADTARKDLDSETRKRVEEANMKTIKWPSDGQYFGDWKKGEAVAQSGRGSTYSDSAGAANGGNCYNCHQISKTELSYGTLGPSLYNYGKLRGNSEAVVKYTWGKIYNAKAYNACTNMPRFGHAGVLTEAQMKDLMALLLDPKSPINQ
ncbi:MAG: sulfur oxidation c-type cytochrome SoxX [Burkholderiaceae bacterium]|jgi:sulfur-oxidizing protein SoxX